MLWRLGENIDPGYLQMVILSTLHLSVSLSCFNKMLEKVWKKMRDRKRKYSSNSGGKFA